MYTRDLQPPRTSFFLFGPRGTGKSTWVRSSFPGAYVVNLLPPEEMLRYQKTPSLFRGEALARSPKDWLIVDEVQRVPALLDEVHFLIEEKGFKRIGLTGSSARKLKRGAANLLAGRAVVRHMSGLNCHELKFSVPIKQLVTYGSLPLSINADTDEAREDFLRSYVNVYLNEEVKSESLVRNIGTFHRFLEVAAILAGQRINVSNVASHAQISRDTARSYFSVLEDTLIGTWLPAYRPRAKVKETAHPKFYWFDAGVVHAARGGFDQPLGRDEFGTLFEHFIHHELRSYMSSAQTRGTLGYWATPSGSEVDFVFWYGKEIVAIEAKYASEYRSEHKAGLASLLANQKARAYLVYNGTRELRVDSIHVLPVETFLRRLHGGDILPPGR